MECVEDCACKKLKGLSFDEIILLAFALEFECNAKIYEKIGEILGKIEDNIIVDCNENRLYEYGRIMGWTEELDNGKVREDL